MDKLSHGANYVETGKRKSQGGVAEYTRDSTHHVNT